MRKSETESEYNLDMKGLRLAAISLGCSKNRVDTEEILGYLSTKGCTITNDYRSADLIIVNTCSFIEEAQQEAVNTLLELTELAESVKGTGGKKPKIVAAGCLVELFGTNIIKDIPAVDGAIGVHSYSSLDYFIDRLFSGKQEVIKNDPPPEYRALSSRLLTTPVHSASVKIAEGCSNRCHYCLIPAIRGPYRSRNPEEIIAEINDLLDQGSREINLIAQDTTAYGHDRENYPDLAGLIEAIMERKSYFRLRIMYTYPSRIDDRLIELIAKEQRICNYLDIPLQHCNDHVLKKMGRLYNRKDLEELIQKLRNQIPDLALRTTLMVGYPGESSAYFNDMLSFIEEYPFESLGAFTYSKQGGTIAGNTEHQVSRRVSKKRYRELMSKQQRIARQLNKKLTGRELTVLIDGTLRPGSKWYYGRSEFQAPEVDGVVYFRSPVKLQPGSWVSVKIKAISSYDLLADNPSLLEVNNN